MIDLLNSKTIAVIFKINAKLKIYIPPSFSTGDQQRIFSFSANWKRMYRKRGINPGELDQSWISLLEIWDLARGENSKKKEEQLKRRKTARIRIREITNKGIKKFMSSFFPFFLYSMAFCFRSYSLLPFFSRFGFSPLAERKK